MINCVLKRSLCHLDPGMEQRGRGSRMSNQAPGEGWQIWRRAVDERQGTQEGRAEMMSG